ncbi:MAG TPA: tetratricopeptide repeat protein [Vicinamibacteria bacterium]|nr:tetratricopeptide repeat protein [Vicinamibacteria bacterium]
MIARRFAHYEVVEKLGSGGMGDVYRARDLKLGRDVAIKFLPARFSADRMRLARFEQEARAASALNHPNLVTVHDVDRTTDGHPFIVMELVKGQTLRQALTPGKPLVTRRALELAAQATEGLAKAHAAGIVHRDLKPENLMITEDGFVKILDFGLAKLMVSDADSEADTAEHRAQDSATADEIASPQTGAGVVLGTTGYMSPEQARGRAVDYRADQFSCGSILYEMATGARAFRRESVAQTLTAIIEDDPEPIPTLNPRCPPPFRWIIERCLKKDPGERYASTLDLARELRTVCDRLEETSAAGGLAAPVAIARRLRKNALRTALGVTLLAAAVAAAWGPLSAWLEGQTVPPQKHLAVLPFSITGEEPVGRALGDGLVETLASKLTRLEGVGDQLWIVPMSEVRAAGVASASAARRAFGVTLVVTGNAQLAKDRVRVTANLVDARTLRQVRSTAPLDMPLSDASLLQDSMVGAVAGLLELELDSGARRLIEQGGTQVAGAYDHYLRGRGHLVRYDDPQSLDLAIGAFQQAIQQDPRFALAYAGLGEAYWRQYELQWRSESVELAQKACQRALAINDLLAPVHVTLGLVRLGAGRAEEAIGDFERALALEPGSAEAQLGLAKAQVAVGRLGDAEATYRKAIDRKPSYWGGYNDLGVFFVHHQRYAEAVAPFSKVIELTPDNPRGYSNLGAVYLYMDRTVEAETMLQRSVAVSPTADALSNLGALQFSGGRYRDAARTLERAATRAPNDYLVWRNLAAAYFWTPGEREKARATYERAVQLAEKESQVNPQDPGLQLRLADCLSQLGKTAEARARLKQALARAPTDAGLMVLAGTVFEQLGDRPRALEWIGRAVGSGYPVAEIKSDPALAALMDDPRFKIQPTAPSSGSIPKEKP